MNGKNLEKIFKKHNVSLAYQFGSSVDGTQTSLSDIDIAVLYKQEPESLEQVLDLRSALSQVYNSDKVDVANLNRSAPLLKHVVATKGKLLYEERKDLDKEFAIKALKEYEDFKYFDDVYYESMRSRL